MAVLLLFAALRVVASTLEHALARYNWRFSTDPDRLARAAAVLHITAADLARSRSYSADRYRLGLVRLWTSTLVVVGFAAAGGLGMLEDWAEWLASVTVEGSVSTGLLFLALVGLASFLLSLPFALYERFVVEQRHGFNRQTPAGFAADLAKGLLVTILVGAPLLSVVLWLMQHAGRAWWLWVWLVASAFSLAVAWLYPRVLAPLFNRFTPLPEGELRDRIVALAAAARFRSDGIWVMDASRRSTHGNAYFTGLFGSKRIVLFDTLVGALDTGQVVAVLAHELGHFKLGHVRQQVVRSVLMTGVMLFALSLSVGGASLYEAFSLEPSTAHGALVVFGLWWELAELVLQPLWHALSRRNERAADDFAARHAPPHELAGALLRLREESHLLPVSHPVYSLVYHSHPSLLERVERLGGIRNTQPSPLQ